MAASLVESKKGIEFFTNWVAIFFVAILVLSFLLAIIIINPLVNYVIAMFGGVIMGHFFYTSRYENRFPFMVLSFAFLAGYAIGHRAGNGFLIIAVFLASLFATRKILEITNR